MDDSASEGRKTPDGGPGEVLRARWAANASEPTLGKLVSAARETGAENDTVLGIKHCVDSLVRKDRKVLGAFKDRLRGARAAHLM